MIANDNNIPIRLHFNSMFVSDILNGVKNATIRSKIDYIKDNNSDLSRIKVGCNCVATTSIIDNNITNNINAMNSNNIQEEIETIVQFANIRIDKITTDNLSNLLKDENAVKNEGCNNKDELMDIIKIFYKDIDVNIDVFDCIYFSIIR